MYFTVECYYESGLIGALGGALIAFLISVWDLIKFALVVLVLVIVFRACLGNSVKSAWSQGELDEVEHFYESLVLIEKASKYLTALGSEPPEYDLWNQEVITRLSGSLAESEKVSDLVLAKIHPSLVFHYRNKLQRSLKTYIYGFEHKNRDSLETALLLIDIWDDWYNANWEILEQSVNR